MKTVGPYARVLVVDDAPENILVLVENLKDDYEVLYATNGEDALELAFSETPPDIILLDILMPGMDGFEVCRRLKAKSETRDIPLIFLTAKTREEDETRGFDLGAQDYIVKPFSIPVVRARVRSVLNLKKEMERRLLLKKKLEELNSQLQAQVNKRLEELKEAQEALVAYERKYSVLFNKRMPPREPEEKKRILVVDDIPDNIHVLMENLKDDYEVFFATSGEDALEICFSGVPPDLILLDIMMPDMDGYAVCSRLKADMETRDIPVIFITAMNEERDETKGFALGAVDYIAKPFSMPIVHARVGAALHLKEEMDHRLRLTRKLEDLNKSLESKIARRVAELRHTQEALRESEGKYRAIYENALEGIFQTGPDGSLLSVNPSLAQVLGYDSPEEATAALGGSIHNLFTDPADRTKVEAILRRDGRVFGFETRFLRKDGREIWCSASARVIRGEDGRAAYVQGFLTDVTKRRRAEEDLASMNRHLERLVEDRTAEVRHKADELERANRRLMELDELKNAFLSMVSHDLRTPLTSVLGFAKLINKDFKRGFEPLAGNDEKLKKRAGRIDRNLSIIVQEGERLTRMIDDFLDLSKIESGGVEWRDKGVDAGAALRRAVDAVSGQFAQKPRVRLVTDIPEKLPTIKIDPDRLEQVLVNLLSNAAKCTQKGDVTIAARPTNGGGLRIRVEDTGIGIPAGELDKIFDKFHQVHRNDTLPGDPVKGTGLGLAICSQIVTHYGGKIWAESEYGRGSSFFVEFPPAASSPEGQA